MDFDPLTLFTPNTKQVENLEIYDRATIIENSDLFPISSITEEELDDAHLQPIHILDLPLLQLKPPAETLIVILKLLSPNEVYNFTTPGTIIRDLDETLDFGKSFEEKGLTEQYVKVALVWLEAYCPRFNTRLKLSYIPYLSTSLKINYETEYNAYLTRLISSDLSWINEQDKTIISKESSLRISENCGRTAQPEIIRKIVIPNLSNYLKDSQYIKLKEPSLTNDNLGLKTWGSSLILSNRLANRNNDYLVNPILELGSGTGLVGITSAILGFDTILTDLKEILPNLKDNTLLNNINAKVKELNWCNPQSFIDEYGEKKFNTILISDPIYSSNHPYWVVDMIDKFLENNVNSRVLVQLPLRPRFEHERELLWSLLCKNYLETETETENGFDDFGEMKFCFKKFVRKERTYN